MKTGSRVGLLLFALGAAGAQAQAYPSKPVRVIVGFAAGGPSDIVARLIAAPLQAELGQPVIVDNKPGAGGTIGALEVARAAPDGYTLLFVPSTFAIAQLTLPPSPSTAHDVVKDYTPVIKTGNIREGDLDLIFSVKKRSFGFSDIKDLTARTAATGHPAHEHPETKQQQKQEAPLNKQAKIIFPVFGMVFRPVLLRLLFFKFSELLVEISRIDNLDNKVRSVRIHTQWAVV